MLNCLSLLIGSETITTLPLETLLSYHDHGNPAPTNASDLAEAHLVLDDLKNLGAAASAA